METTAAALMLTSLISDPDADGLMAYLCIPENSRTMNTQIVCDLEMLCYLNQFTPPMDGDVATFRYQLGKHNSRLPILNRFLEKSRWRFATGIMHHSPQKILIG